MNQMILLQDEPRGPSILIETLVQTGQTRVPLPDVQQLRSTADRAIIIKGFQLVTLDSLTRGILIDAPNAPATEIQKMTLTLYAEGWEKGQNIPLAPLNDVTTQAATFPHRYKRSIFDNWQKVDFPKSYLQFAAGTAAVGGPYVVILDCLYIKLDAKGNEIQGPA